MLSQCTLFLYIVSQSTGGAMVTVNFTVFRQNAKAYFAAVEKGETVCVKRHGKIIARILPAMRKEPVWHTKALRLKIPEVSLSQAILEERRQDR